MESGVEVMHISPLEGRETGRENRGRIYFGVSIPMTQQHCLPSQIETINTQCDRQS